MDQVSNPNEMSKLVQNIIPIGLNRDDDQRAMSPGDSPSMVNVIRQPGKGGVLSPIKGTHKVYEEDEAITSQMIGSCEDKERGVKILFFYETYQGVYVVHDSLSIREWDGEEMTPIVERIWSIYPQGVSPNDIKLECDVSSGMLFWTYGVGEPRKLNIEMMKGYTAHKDAKYYGGTSITVNVGDEVYIDGVGVYRIDSLPVSNYTLSEPGPAFLRAYCTKLWGPIYWAITGNTKQTLLLRTPPMETAVSRVMESGLDRTELVDVVYRFAYRYIYYDEERSVFSQPSEPLMNPYYGGDPKAVQFNAVDVTVDVGKGDIKGVEIAVHDMVGDTWYKAGELLRSNLRGVTGEHTFRFTASSVGGVIPQEEVDRSHDSVPISCDHIIAAEGRVLTVGVTEGMDMQPPPTVSVSIEQGTVEYAFNHTVTYNQNDWTNTQSGTKRFAHKRYLSNYTHDAVPPAGVTVEVLHQWLDYGPVGQQPTGREWSTRFTTDGTETMLGFTERVANGLNGRTYYQSPYTSIYRTNLNLWYTYYVDGGYVRLIECVGLERELRIFLTDSSISGINTFINNGPGNFYGQITVEAVGDYYWNFAIFLMLGGRSYQFGAPLGATLTFGFDPGTAIPIFKGGATYSIGPYYMDAYGRKTPCPSLTQFQMPDYQYKNYYRDVEVTINGRPPQDARYWGLCRSQGSMADVEQIHLLPQGLSSIGSIKNNPYSNSYESSFIMDLAIEGVREEDTDSGKLYWGMDSFNRFVLTKNQGTVTSGIVARSVRPFSLTQKLLTKRPIWDSFKRDILKMDVGAIAKVKGEQEAQLRGVGTDITGHVKIGWPNYSRPYIPETSYIEVDFDSYKTGSTGAWEYRLDIAPYINTLKINIEDESQIFIPQEGDSVRVLEDISNKSKSNGLLTIARVEGSMLNDDEGNLFKHFFIYSHPSSANLNFSSGGYLEIYRVRKGKAHLLFEEDRIFPVVWSGSYYVHGGGEQLGGGGVKVKTHKGDAYLRKRDFIGMDGSIVKTMMVESPRASDHFPSKVWGSGRVNAEGQLERKYFPTAVRHGGRLLEGTMINNIPTFHAKDITLLDSSYGRIVGAASIPNGVRLVFTRRAVTIDLGVMVVTRPDGQSELTATDRFIGSIRPSVNRWGCTHRSSFVSTPRGLYYYDAHNGQMLSDGANGQHPISGRVVQGEHSHDYKMHTYFKDLTEGDTVVSGWDEGHGMLFVRVNGDCVAFSRGDHRWMGPYSLGMSERFEHLGRDLFAVIGNGMYQLHHSGDTLLEYPRGASIDLIANDQPQLIKIFDAIRLRMEGVEWDKVPNDFIQITITENDTYREMYSVITKGMLMREEGQYVAQILKNMKTTSDTAKNSDLHNGMEMRGYVARVRLNFGSSDFSFLSSDVVMEHSV